MAKELKKIKKITETEVMEYSVSLKTAKDTERYVKRIERIVRTSKEYRDYIDFLRENIDMTKCAFFNNVDNKENRRIKIEVHHEPLTLFYITLAVVNKYIAEAIPLNDLYIADEVMDIHYRNLVGLIPLSKSIHKYVHNNGNMVIPLYLVYGDYQTFMQEYGQYLDDHVYELLETKIAQTKAVKEDSFSMLEKQFTYIEIDGVSLPQKIEQKGNQTA